MMHSGGELCLDVIVEIDTTVVESRILRERELQVEGLVGSSHVSVLVYKDMN